MLNKRDRLLSDIAYGCFAVIAIGVLIAGILEFLPIQWSDATAAGLGFLVLIPLTMLAGACSLVGIACSILRWKDWRLPVLSAATVALPILFVISDEKGWNSLKELGLTAVIYLVFSFGWTSRWFFSERRRVSR